MALASVAMTNYFQPGLLKGRAALVTGGGTGICRGIALALASAGCDVAITSRKQEHLEPAVEELQRAGVRTFALAGDVRDPSAVDRQQLATLDVAWVSADTFHIVCGQAAQRYAQQLAVRLPAAGGSAPQPA